MPPGQSLAGFAGSRPHQEDQSETVNTKPGCRAIWAIAGAASNNCGSQKGDQYLSAHDAQAACAAGTGIGVALIFFLWFIGFIILAIVWFMSRPKGRACPRCGENVKRGVMQCRSCGFDFATMGQPSSRQTVAT
jgi:hypothetical protein